jgi:hypothetical protein
MPTIDSEEIIKDLLKNNGCYYDDPQAFVISQYRNCFDDRIAFHIAYDSGDHNSLLISPHCKEVKTLWTRAFGLTMKGQDLIK